MKLIYNEKKHKKNAIKIDSKILNNNFELGIVFKNSQFQFNLWQPEAQKVELLVFKGDKLIETFECIKNKNNVWQYYLDKKYQDFFYQYLITQKDKNQTIALDPYAKALAPFDWKGQTNKKVAKGIIFDAFQNQKYLKKIQLKKMTKPIIYELNIRDYSFRTENDNKKIGSFNSAIKNNIFKHLNKLGFTYLQLLPLQATYSLNDVDQKYIDLNEAKFWNTNYNWGYDPHNYFALNRMYTESSDHYQSIQEFQNFVKKAHNNNIGVIVDVVYNHMMTNTILDNIIPNYYFRDNTKVFPVDQPALDTKRIMARKLVVDSLKYWVKQYDIDGFRFDLSCFMDKKTIDEIYKELKKLKPNLLLHGEAWPFSDLDHQESYIKGVTQNNFEFAYFNDSIRNSIKGNDEISELSNGLVNKFNQQYYYDFLYSIIGNWNYVFPETTSFKIPSNIYAQFAKNPNMTLQYSACHDGFTLWDKINITNNSLELDHLIERYRQALLMQLTTQGKQLFLAGTEFLQSKPTDRTGQDFKRSVNVIQNKDFFKENFDNLGFNNNTYKTSDFTNRLKWEHLNNPTVKAKVYDFFKKLNNFHKDTNFFNLVTKTDFKKYFKFTILQTKIVGYQIIDKISKAKILVIHNFGDTDYEIKNKNCKILFRSNYKNIKSNKVMANESVICETK